MSKYGSYTGKSLEFLKSNNVQIGDYVVIKGIIDYEGTLMPRYESNAKDVIVLKLKNGYNVGIRIDNAGAKKITTSLKSMVKIQKNKIENKNPEKILLLSTGGTIASKIDYRTGAVTPVLLPEDLLTLMPELVDIANIDVKTIFSEHSENIVPEQWVKVAKFLDGLAKSEYVGIIITHGTDTMQHTASYLAFALQGFPKPVILTGSQRSSDRPSSDAASNLIGSMRFLVSNPNPGIFVAMQQNGDDVAVHLATRVRKNHTSKRGAFETIGSNPAYIVTDGKVEKNLEFFNSDQYLPKITMNTKVGLVKYYPGFDSGIIDYAVNSGYRALILEGTGLGHVGRTMYDSIINASHDGIFLGMTSQCIDGNVNMNVYESGRDLQKMGVIPLSGMLPETALVKAMWATGFANSVKDIQDMMTQNIAGEFA
ncbi:MAG: glutamyl-tRNA(Gln) amidotransferase subunit D [Cenarchaeum symbiont of Oopsacas minuta]|nr:glutamyl-tRNA(Gln) amidotransferase subunit D [Cenarchaeum symbiont of Oopsacas minuta]